MARPGSSGHQYQNAVRPAGLRHPAGLVVWSAVQRQCSLPCSAVRPGGPAGHRPVHLDQHPAWSGLGKPSLSAVTCNRGTALTRRRPDSVLGWVEGDCATQHHFGKYSGSRHGSLLRKLAARTYLSMPPPRPSFATDWSARSSSRPKYQLNNYTHLLRTASILAGLVET